MTSGEHPSWWSVLEYDRRCYELTKNPIHVWRAYQMCSEMMEGGFVSDPLPSWIREYFDGIADVVQQLFGDLYADSGSSAARARINEQLAAALGLLEIGQGAKSSAFKDHDLQQRDMRLAMDVRHAKRCAPDRPFEDIFGEVAERKQLGVDIVKRAWNRWRVFVEDHLGRMTSGEVKPQDG